MIVLLCVSNLCMDTRGLFIDRNMEGVFLRETGVRKEIGTRCEM